MTRAFVGIGSNILPEQNIPAAVRRLAQLARVIGVSTFYRTRPIGSEVQPWFINGVVEVETEYPPAQFKGEVLRRIEAEQGRERGTDQFAPRTIDLDLLLYDSWQLATETLHLPDPAIAERPFLAKTLAELDPHLIVPGFGSIRAIADHLPGDDMEAMPMLTAELREEIAHGSQTR